MSATMEFGTILSESGGNGRTNFFRFHKMEKGHEHKQAKGLNGAMQEMEVGQTILRGNISILIVFIEKPGKHCPVLID
ncbi:hypothetical protein V7149_19520 [Bacillus sp. JJ1503]|uniref:hypothetical protein n=1 Tax=Bacillus sp. JJ1503 TaxID=3122956 RepID=UPI002FFFAB60